MNIRMLKVVLLSLACVATVSSSSKTAKKIQRNINTWNADVACWGKENALKFHAGLAQAIEQCGDFGSPASLVKPATRTGTISGLTISVITVRDARLMRPLVVFLRLMKRISRSSWKILRITRKIWDTRWAT